QEGSTVSIGATFGHITEPSLVEFVTSAPAAGAPPPKRQVSDDGTEPALRQPPPPREPRHAAARPAAQEDGRAPLSPAARRLAREAHVDADEIAGSGRGGRVTREDVVSHLQMHDTRAEEQLSPSRGPTAPVLSIPSPSGRGAGGEGAAPPQPRESRRKMTGIRQRIAERLVTSRQTTATLTTFNEADLSAVMALRAQYKEQFRE